MTEGQGRLLLDWELVTPEPWLEDLQERGGDRATLPQVEKVTMGILLVPEESVCWRLGPQHGVLERYKSETVVYSCQLSI